MYDHVIEFVKNAGERLREKAGNIPDIGVTKDFLTEEDLRIEREFGELIKTFGPDHRLFAEEEHDFFEMSDNVWVMDPISGTSIFMSGMPHYGIVVSHLVKGVVKFAMVYDPAMRHSYIAEQGKGMFLNGNRQHMKVMDERSPKVLLVVSRKWNPPALFARFAAALTEFNVYRFPLSDGISYAYVASGKFDGVIALTKDTFPDFAGSLLVKEAGGIFTNREGGDIKPTDRVFVAGHPSIHAKLLQITQKAVQDMVR
ncbi:MAG: inositol monophosphatase [Candidatus Taylorbacteria bacterium]|nr:inositol monophosphatase [Candidatus Taylorbacteria bacterium]